MADLSVTFVGKKLRSPVGVASHALVRSEHDVQALAVHLKGYVDAGAGYVYTPFINPEQKHPKGMAPAYKFMHELISRCHSLGVLLFRVDKRRIDISRSGIHIPFQVDGQGLNVMLRPYERMGRNSYRTPQFFTDKCY
jgi:hypothetical protein